MNAKFWAGTFTLVGSIIGAGFLGLPYVFAKSGFLVGAFWLVFLGAVLLIVNLYFAEIILATKEKHQITGYASKYLGRFGRVVAFFAMIFGVYSALVAYLIGEGQSVSQLLPGQPSPLIVGFIFWLLMTLLLHEGLTGLKRVETYGALAIILLVGYLFISLFGDIEVLNLATFDKAAFAAPIGIVLFALLGFTAIPEVRREMYGQEARFKKAIVYGSLIPVALYILFSVTVLGVVGAGVAEIATLSLGPLVTILGIFTMLTSYLVLSFALRDTFKYDLRVSPLANFFFTSLVPLLIFVVLTVYDLLSFSTILGAAGVISAGVTGILIVVINQKMRATSKLTSEKRMPINWLIIAGISALFIVATILQFMS